MKTLVICSLALGLLTVNSFAAPPETAAADPDRILQNLDDSHPELEGTTEEESEHTERVRRLYELEKEKQKETTVIEEPSGADLETTTYGSAEEDRLLVRLIQVIEELQVEVRQLRQAVETSDNLDSRDLRDEFRRRTPTRSETIPQSTSP